MADSEGCYGDSISRSVIPSVYGVVCVYVCVRAVARRRPSDYMQKQVEENEGKLRSLSLP